MNNPFEEIFKRLENIEKMIAPVMGAQPEELAARYSVRLFTVLNRKSYRTFNRLSMRSFFDCQPSICRASSLLFFFIGKSVRSRDILLLHPLFEFLHVETQGTPTLDTRYQSLAG